MLLSIEHTIQSKIQLIHHPRPGGISSERVQHIIPSHSYSKYFIEHLLSIFKFKNSSFSNSFIV
jgi:hypothetical protein